VTPSASAFAGFPAEAFAWFEELEASNTREWFAAHRDTYDRAVRGPLEALLDEIADELGGEVKVFRQHRDVRFSPDKSPYKTRTYGVVYAAPAGLFVQVDRDGLFAGTGFHELDREQLERFRAAVAHDAAGPVLEAALEAAHAEDVETYGEALKTAPRGYPRDHQRIALLRRKALIAGRRLPAEGGIGRDAALEHVAGTWRAAAPVNAWLDANVGQSELPPPPPRGRRR
jgi:uncharacterized protein (TIGR02453 family)